MKNEFYYQAGSLIAAAVSSYTGRSRTVTQTKTKTQKNPTMYGAPFMTRRSRWGRYKKLTTRSVNRKVEANEEDLILRWQAVSRFGFGPGYQSIMTCNIGDILQPLHIFDLTQFEHNGVIGNKLFGGMHNMSTQFGTGHNLFYPIARAQDVAGDPQIGPFYTSFPELGNIPAGSPPVENATLKWVDLRMNLYGSYQVPIKFKVSIVQFHDEQSVPGFGDTTPRAMSQFESMYKSFKYSNLLTNVVQQGKSFRIIKSWNYTIQPLPKSDAAEILDENVLPSPNMAEVKAFIKLDRYCDYAWHDDPVPVHLTADKPSTDQFQVVDSEIRGSVYPVKRLFLIIQAFSAAETGRNQLQVGPSGLDTKWGGSYDIILRRKFKIPPQV